MERKLGMYSFGIPDQKGVPEREDLPECCVTSIYPKLVHTSYIPYPKKTANYWATAPKLSGSPGDLPEKYLEPLLNFKTKKTAEPSQLFGRTWAFRNGRPLSQKATEVRCAGLAKPQSGTQDQSESLLPSDHRNFLRTHQFDCWASQRLGHLLGILFPLDRGPSSKAEWPIANWCSWDREVANLARSLQIREASCSNVGLQRKRLNHNFQPTSDGNSNWRRRLTP